jgi:hypothetical protein
MASLITNRVEGLRAEIEKLSPSEKAQLCEALGLTWINSASVEALGRLLRAIAHRVESKS